jgi:hypothetical protein
MATTPTSRSRKLLESEGYVVALVEKRIPGRFISVDLWNFGDLLACHADRSGALIVQSTSTSHQADRLAKTLRQPALRTWLSAGNKVEIHGWLKSRKTGRWQVTRRDVTLADMQATAALHQATQATCGGSEAPEGPSRGEEPANAFVGGQATGRACS